ncbi:hypothetical protein B0T19DRAFT_468587 [Cercophora scortea]|uniref:Uncharacterized protein n=1 Tax=Cercophora scortea TaxID=314031 RepID=A0AAE0I830_9PEZI|nr:hypothetical protein B0T19DRAFT_468587 [Cercophora scortea]
MASSATPMDDSFASFMEEFFPATNDNTSASTHDADDPFSAQVATAPYDVSVFNGPVYFPVPENNGCTTHNEVGNMLVNPTTSVPPNIQSSAIDDNTHFPVANTSLGRGNPGFATHASLVEDPFGTSTTSRDRHDAAMDAEITALPSNRKRRLDAADTNDQAQHSATAGSYPSTANDTKFKGKNVPFPLKFSNRTSQSNPKYGYNTGLCGNRHCRKPDHELSHCRGPPSDKGDIVGCVLCNTDEHILDACHRVKHITPHDLYIKLVLNRKDLPPIRTSINILLLATRLDVLVRFNNFTFPLTKDRVISHWIPKKLWKLPATSSRAMEPDPSLPHKNFQKLIWVVRNDWDKYTRAFTFTDGNVISPENMFLENTWVWDYIPFALIKGGMEYLEAKGLVEAYKKRQEMAFFQVPHLVRVDERKKILPMLRSRDEQLDEMKEELKEAKILVKNLSELLAKKGEMMGNEAGRT